jgi:hypothetical protein
MKCHHAITVLLALLSLNASGAVVVNEVLSDEPGSETSLEWIELYNSASTAADLQYYQLRVPSTGGLLVHTLSGALAPGAYRVYCRDTVRFEEHWGDSSGVWGDAASEQYEIRELTFRFVNDSGRVRLTQLVSPDVSELAWTQSGRDGYSWERYFHTLNQIGQSVDPSGSTPGRINSITPMPVDLALEGVEVLSEAGKATIAFRIVNRGLADISNAILELYKFDPGESDSLGSLVAGEPVGVVDSGLAVLLIGQYQFERYYQKLVGQLLLISDNRPSNNRFIFTAPGENYPPVILSEFLPEPDPESESEWIEVKNISDTAIDLSSWMLGDSAGLSLIAATQLLIDPGEYLVVAEDTIAFDLVYPAFMGKHHQPDTWRTLNNGSDSVRLVDAFDIQADRFYYDRTYDSNYTWARSESPEFDGRWGRSEDVGGTPGAANSVRFMPEGSRTLSVEVTPRIISPDGDGVDDSTMIIVQASEADGYTLKLYDAQGRLVRTLEDDAPDMKEYYVWRGEGDDGKKQPIGIYILYVEAVGVESAKKTIVVAR